MKAPLGFRPKARREGIITKQVDGELLVYDLERDKAHCLNPSAAAIWKLCDGRTTTEEIERRSRSDGRATAESIQSNEAIVWLALSELRRSHLLEETSDGSLWPQQRTGLSRREAVRLFGIGIAIPAVLSITAPTARAAASCLAKCSPCSTGSECCSGTCFSGSVSGCSNTESVCT